MYVADTHALIWYFTNDPKLGHTCKKILELADAGLEEVAVPTIVVAEALYISRKLGFSFNDFFKKIKNAKGYSVIGFNTEIIEIMEGLPEEYSIHDAVIVATAKLLKAPLLSKDSIIKKTREIELIW